MKMIVGSNSQTEKMELVSNAEPMYQESRGTPHTELMEISTSPNASRSRSIPSIPSAEIPSKKTWSAGLQKLLDTSNPGKGIERYGLSIFQTFFHYIWNDLFTTLLTAPRLRFILIFFVVYLTVYLTFAIIYIMFPASCMNDTHRDFGHTFWFSFSTASTIGYSGDQYPNPDCDFFYLITMVEIITATMLDYLLMGVIFARFSAPLPKAKAIRFSTHAVLYQHQDHQNLWCLSFRIANIRKHCLLSPNISLLLAVPENSPDSSNAALRFIELEVYDTITQITNIKLGLPATIAHVVTPSSPIFDLSLEQMEQRGFQLFCFLDGMDPMTSSSLQARHSYRPSDIRVNEQFTAIELQANKRGQMGLNFNQFDRTAPARKSVSGETSFPDMMTTTTVRPDMGPHETQWLRTQVFRSISILDSGVEGPGFTEFAKPPVARGEGIDIIVAATENHVSQDNSDYPRHSLNDTPHQTWIDFTAQSTRNIPEKSHAIQSLIDAVLADSSASASLKRVAALAKAGRLSAGFPHERPGHSDLDNPKLQIPLSLVPYNNSQGRNNANDKHANLMLPQ
ncbi:hypothetical protein CEUSTIGMA_g11875.t1 [Chlamydomonas eustigma]|uniref:Potassium channel domain-containing protein n=1 Tax=Chlamydomonas eustigma TaxID=1157962 RepID=A0A250XMZ6_9CHLO|nr:hypothetical protein CEUSTIGMA_g11875.t1 [Chlamydomonas eustigma]|eukprot:GAX84455.1 hypothetical protein CEUSTIGMA_g11875.t1 [Chlamydomonas eustigma]